MQRGLEGIGEYWKLLERSGGYWRVSGSNVGPYGSFKEWDDSYERGTPVMVPLHLGFVRAVAELDAAPPHRAVLAPVAVD